MEKIRWTIILLWPAVTGFMHIPFFWVLLPGIIITLLAMIMKAKDGNFQDALQALGGLAVFFMIWSIIYSLTSGTIVGPDTPGLSYSDY